MILLITYRNGMIIILNDTKEQRIPLFPYFTSGTNTSHAKRLELIGYSDQVNVPDKLVSCCYPLCRRVLKINPYQIYQFGKIPVFQ